MIYWNMAVFKDKIGQNSFEYQQKSQQSRLLNLRQQGKTKVKINADNCSESCKINVFMTLLISVGDISAVLF